MPSYGTVMYKKVTDFNSQTVSMNITICLPNIYCKRHFFWEDTHLSRFVQNSQDGDDSTENFCDWCNITHSPSFICLPQRSIKPRTADTFLDFVSIPSYGGSQGPWCFFFLRYDFRCAFRCAFCCNFRCAFCCDFHCAFCCDFRCAFCCSFCCAFCCDFCCDLLLRMC